MKLYFKMVTGFALIIALIFCIVPFGTAMATTAEHRESRYSGYGTAMLLQEATGETISYTRKEEYVAETIKGVPRYTQVADLPNSCGAIAGAIVVGFYDK